MKIFKKSIIAGIMCIFWISLAGQAPSAFQFQAVLRDLSGQPIINQNVNVRISITDELVGGMLLYSELHNTMSNNFGLISLSIGLGGVLDGDFENIDWSNGEKFLQTEFDPESSGNFQLLGTQQLLSVPYALYAASSGNQLIAGEGINITGDTIKNNSPSLWKAGMSGSINYVAGRVGIGTTNPARLFHVDAGNSAGTFPSSGFAILGGGSTSIPDQLNTNLVIGRTDAQQGTMWMQAFHSGTAPDTDWRLSLNPSIGNVGVGTYNPRTRFHVSDGDVYLDSISSGVILRSPNGSCFRVRVDNSGQLTTQAISCP